MMRLFDPVHCAICRGIVGYKMSSEYQGPVWCSACLPVATEVARKRQEAADQYLAAFEDTAPRKVK